MIFLSDCTGVPFSLLFWRTSPSRRARTRRPAIAVDRWIVFRSPARIAHLVKPAPVDWQGKSVQDCAVITAIIDLITTQEKPAGTKGYGRAWRLSAPKEEQHVYFCVRMTR
ncbi:ATP-dependent DNA/RNA helicase DHX36 [Lates japonicus]|uniref:ATP-dependent DNA/RNA helicase DHX36 n=1 Tax=Lates japonicus TaxID=270547 RepID=A0AAD3RN20_LATJO|nr:ATP-dependent DNA/RNA helicase DHX36 [Lates japonicus]